MSEIEKLYENAGIEYEERYNNCTLNKEGDCELKCSCDICKYSEEKYIYPPFTAEKQLEIIKWLCKKCSEFYIAFNDYVKFENWEMVCDLKFSVHRNSFEDCLCGFTINLWQDLSDTEKAEIKRILNGC